MLRARLKHDLKPGSPIEIDYSTLEWTTDVEKKVPRSIPKLGNPEKLECQAGGWVVISWHPLFNLPSIESVEPPKRDYGDLEIPDDL